MNLIRNSDRLDKRHLHTLLGLFVLLLVWQTISLAFLPKSKVNASDLTALNVLSAVSAERTLRNLNALNSDNRLSSAAQFKADDMMQRRYFSHTDPEGNYIWGKIAAAGYSPYLQLGENLAIEFYNTESLILAWMNSPTHRANILNQGFNDQGMGLAFGSPQQGQYYSTIANTFGALAAPKKISILPAATDQTPSPAPAPSPTPQQSATPPDNPKKPALEPLRSSELAQNFALPEQAPTTPTTAPSTLPKDSAVIETAPKQPQGPTSYEINRYLMLGLAGVLILLLAGDLKKIFVEKFHAYDKKINNLVLLILSLIVIALMYWL